MYFKNLKKSLNAFFFLVIRGRFSFMALLLCVDRLGNALAGGDHRTTISGRVGFFAMNRRNKYWLALQWIVDQTFLPYEGRGHCRRAYKWESKRGLTHNRGNDVALLSLSVIVLIACLLLAPIVYILSLAKRF